MSERPGQAPSNIPLEGLSLLGYGQAQAQGKPIPAVNPATGVALEPPYFYATRQDVNHAAELAAQAFGEYRHWTAAKRAALLRAMAQRIELHADTIQARAHDETALPLSRLQGETARTCGQLRLFATLLEEGWWCDARVDHAEPNRKPLPKPDLRSMLVPLGPVAVFSSSNFPLAFSVAGGDVASALAAGCPVIVKAHSGHLGTSELVGKLVLQAAKECAAPEGIYSLLFGRGHEVGLALVKHPLLKAMGFTGSRAGGRALMDAAAERPAPIPVYAEMSSVNPTFLLRGALEANAETIASGLHASVTLGVGQFCTKPGLVFVERGPAAKAFVAKLEAAVIATPAATMLTADICSAFRDGLERFARLEGVRRVESSAPSLASGISQASAVVFAASAKTFLSNPELREEVFGPCTLIVECDSPDQMLAAARALEGQLTATLHGTTADLAASGDLVAILEEKAGRLLVNGFPTGVEVCHAMTHGGPYPATSDGRSTSVGTRAIQRFVRAVCYQNFPEALLPDELKEANPLGIRRFVDGKYGGCERAKQFAPPPPGN